MKKSALVTLPMLSLALLLGGCAPSTTDPAPAASTSSSLSIPGGSSPGNGTGGSNKLPDPSASTHADAATLAYVTCLNDHGLRAVVGPDGTVQYAVGEGDVGSDGRSFSSGGDTERAETEALCQRETPGYTPPDYNEK